MKIVIFTQRVEVVESYQERRDCADQRIARFIRACGYLAVPLPNRTEGLEELLEYLTPAGIVLTGGNSLVKYGGNAPERDELDVMLIRLAERLHYPLFGFCRGMQSILDYYGNSMETVDGHVAKRHMVYSKTGEFEVNSYHNQACVELEKNCELNILARAEDGVIEAVSHKRLPIIGTMWHPERESVFTQQDVERIKKLFQ